MIQVTTPSSTALTTVDLAAAELGTSDTGRLTSIIEQASAACVGFCGRSFAQVTCTETFFGSGYPLILTRRPVVSVTSVTEMGSALDVDDYTLDPDAGLIHRPTCGGWHQHLTVVAVYVAGYLLPNDEGRTLPADVERACLEVVKALWFTTGDGVRDPSIRSESVEGVGSTSYLDPVAAAGGLPALAAGLLTPYRRVGL